MKPLTDAEIESYSKGWASDVTLDALCAQAKEANALRKRQPLCPPCDIGENTECICDAPLVPKAWMDAALDERDALREAQQWRPIETNKPSYEVEVLVYENGNDCAVAWLRGDETWHVSWPQRRLNMRPTHWMPLSSPPKEAHGEKVTA